MEDYIDKEMDSEDTVQLTDKMKDYLTETARWAKFIAIVGFVILGILFCALLALALSSSVLAQAFPGMEGMGAAGLGVLFLYSFFMA